MNKSKIVTLGAALAVSLTAAPVVMASTNPFALTPISQGYLIAKDDVKKPAEPAKAVDTKSADKKADEKAKDAKCGAGKSKEGKCGAESKAKDGKCGAKEGHCDAEKKGKECKCGAESKAKDAKCGEGTCGGKKKDK